VRWERDTAEQGLCFAPCNVAPLLRPVPSACDRFSSAGSPSLKLRRCSPSGRRRGRSELAAGWPSFLHRSLESFIQLELFSGYITLGRSPIRVVQAHIDIDTDPDELLAHDAHAP